MASLAKNLTVRRSIYSSLFAPMFSIADDQLRVHLESEHLVQINKPILDYYVPLRNSNKTELVKDEMAEHISFLERRNRNLTLRITDLETKMRAIEPYIPTIIKIISDYETAERRIEEKKKKLIRKSRKHKDFELWAGATEDVDVADTTLDEMLGNIEE